MAGEEQGEHGERAVQGRAHGEGHEGGHTPTPLRTANGIVAALLVVIFLAHAVLGSVKFANLTFVNHFSWIIWVGVAAIVVHIIMSVGTTVSMYTDTERPPSEKKKRHQVLKWVTGCVLLAVAALHMAFTSGLGTGGNVAALRPVTFALMAALIAALAWHIFVASKSLLKDLHVPHHRRYRPWMQAVFLAVAAAAGAILVAAMFS